MLEIYYIEDDETIAGTVKEYLEQCGYRVSIFGTIVGAKQALKRKSPALVLVDWNMPDGNGTQLVSWIRARQKELPVIFLTVRGDSGDIVRGFKNGADDYVVKPFELEVLLSRIKALIRRTGDVSKQYLSCGAISVDLKRTLVFQDGEELSLSPLE